jgi:phosphohistidine phosphatase
MKRLMLLRHAKSDWSAAVPDHDRQLNQRGREAADRMGRYIADSSLIPDRILCSTALRAVETLSLVQPHLTPAPDVIKLAEIYNFGTGTGLLDVIRQNGGDAATLLLIGHNPAIEGLADLLSGTGDEEAMNQLAIKYPTAGLSVITLDISDWEQIEPSCGHLASFVRPKQLQ